MTGKRRMGLWLVGVWLVAATAFAWMHTKAPRYDFLASGAGILGTLAVLYMHPLEL